MDTQAQPAGRKPVIGVVGSSGFVGKQLVAELRAQGQNVLPLQRSQAPGAVHFDVQAPVAEQLETLKGVDTVYYLVHSMASGKKFQQMDREAAKKFGEAAHQAGVNVIYLGGLYPDKGHVSEHLASRREVGQILQDTCGALVVRAGVLVGEGSSGFDCMARLATEGATFPFIRRTTVPTRAVSVIPEIRGLNAVHQPIDANTAVKALAGARRFKGPGEVDLVGPDVLSYKEMLRTIADTLKLRPVFPPARIIPTAAVKLATRFLFPEEADTARALVGSLGCDTISDGSRPNLCKELGIRPPSFKAAVRRALVHQPVEARGVA